MKFTHSIAIATLAALVAAPAVAAELPTAIKALADKGVQVLDEFEAPGELRGFAASINGRGVGLYLTADGDHVLVGSLLDAQGEDLTRGPLEELVYEPQGQELWQRLEDSTWIADGAADAPRTIYMFSDPNCPFCNMFWEKARPWVEAGDVQLRHVMVGMLREDSVGKSAALLAADDPEAALEMHEAAGKASKLKALRKIPAGIEQQLTANLTLMREMGAHATPAIVYQDGDGRLQIQQGVPQPHILNQVMGPLNN